MNFNIPSIKEGKVLVDSFLRDSAARFPEKVALICGERRLTYAQIDNMANRVANSLLSCGEKRGDRVAVFLDNSVEAVLSVFGALKAGAVFVVINKSTKLDKLKHVINNCRATALITDKHFRKSLDQLLTRTPSLTCVHIADDSFPVQAIDKTQLVSMVQVLEQESDIEPPQRCIDIDLAALIYTSGSTGLPKGVTLTHQNMVAAATSITTYLENVSSDIILNLLPMSFDYGLYQVLMGFKVGGTVVLEKSFLYPYAVIETILREKVTGFPVVPTIAAMLLKLQNLEKHDFSNVRYISNTAAHMPSAHVKRLSKIFPKARLYLMYGLTECKRVSYLPPDQVEKRPNSVGVAMPNTEVYIVDEKGQKVGPGVVGELVVRGANVMKEYWESPQETAKMLHNGPHPWEKVLYTGDLFKMDKDGYLYFVARKDDIIKSRGEKVSPKEVENVLHAMEGIVEAAVIGVDDKVLGQAIKAFVVLSGSKELTEKQVIRHCAQRLEDFMVPKYVEFCKALPKTSSGKTKKTDLI